MVGGVSKLVAVGAIVAALTACDSSDVGSGVDAIARVDGAQGARTWTDAECEAYGFSARGPDGATIVTTRYFAYVDVGPPSEATVMREVCDLDQRPAPSICPAGWTCTEQRTPPPFACLIEPVTAFTADGLAIVDCGYTTESRDAAGNVTGTTAYRWGSVRIAH